MRTHRTSAVSKQVSAEAKRIRCEDPQGSDMIMRLQKSMASMALDSASGAAVHCAGVGFGVGVVVIVSPPHVRGESKGYALAAGEAIDLTTGWNFGGKADREAVEEYIRKHTIHFF